MNIGVVENQIIPSGFRPVLGLRSARLLGEGTGGLRANGRGRLSPSQKAGLRYEAHVHKGLRALLGTSYRPGQWLEIEDGWGTRRLQPDAFHIFDGFCFIFEVKLSHSERAWWQLRRSYQPALEMVFGLPIRVCEITKTYDPGVSLPEVPHLMLNVGDFLEYLLGKYDSFGVFRLPRPLLLGK